MQEPLTFREIPTEDFKEYSDWALIKSLRRDR
jgi:hypothetical protein